MWNLNTLQRWVKNFPKKFKKTFKDIDCTASLYNAKENINIICDIEYVSRRELSYTCIQFSFYVPSELKAFSHRMNLLDLEHFLEATNNSEEIVFTYICDIVRGAFKEAGYELKLKD